MNIIHLSYALVLGAACVGLTADQIKPPPRPQIAYIGYRSAADDPGYAAFVAALTRKHPELLQTTRLRYVIGSDQDDAALEAAIREAIAEKAAILVAPTAEAALMASRTGATVIFVSYVDPQNMGIIKSRGLRRERITGISLDDRWLDGKRLEILHDAVPLARRIAVLADRSWARDFGGESRIAAEAARHGLQATIVSAETPADVESTMSAPNAADYDAWYVPPTYVAYLAEASILGQLRRLAKPAIFATSEEVMDGGLLAYELDKSFVWETVAELTARVLAGEDPGRIPIERPRRFVLSVRVTPSEGLPPVDASVVRRADRVY